MKPQTKTIIYSFLCRNVRWRKSESWTSWPIKIILDGRWRHIKKHCNVPGCVLVWISDFYLIGAEQTGSGPLKTASTSCGVFYSSVPGRCAGFVRPQGGALTCGPASSTHSLAQRFLASASTLNMVQSDGATRRSVDLLIFCILASNAALVLQRWWMDVRFKEKRGRSHEVRPDARSAQWCQMFKKKKKKKGGRVWERNSLCFNVFRLEKVLNSVHSFN